MSALRRVLMVVRPASGGIRQHVLTLLERLPPARYRILVAAPPEFLAALPPRYSDVIYPLPITPHLSPLADLRASQRLGELSRNADLVHVHGLRAGWVAAIAQTQHTIPLIVSAHNLVPASGFLSRAGLRWIGRRAARVVAVSQAVTDGLMQAGVPRSKITIIPNGIDIAHFEFAPPREQARRELGIMPSGTSVIGCVARLSPEKGVDVLMSAAAQLPEVTFLVAGDGPEQGRLASLAPPNVRWLGRIPDTRPLLRAADVVAIPSRQEGQGLVALEAMASGTPLVASRIGGLAEMLQDGTTALLVPPGDPVALAQSLRRLLDDISLRQQLAANGRMLVLKNYDVVDMMRKIEEVYEGV